MAFTVTRYRSSNPGLNSRGFDVTALDADTATTITHNCPWTPDSWTVVSTDGSACQYVGQYRAQVNATTAVLTKTAGGGGGAVRLTLERTATRP